MQEASLCAKASFLSGGVTLDPPPLNLSQPQNNAKPRLITGLEVSQAFISSLHCLPVSNPVILWPSPRMLGRVRSPVTRIPPALFQSDK